LPRSPTGREFFSSHRKAIAASGGRSKVRDGGAKAKCRSAPRI
jgi:hypothetical protein